MADQNMPNPDKMPVIEELKQFEEEVGIENREGEPGAIKSASRDAGMLRERIEHQLPEIKDKEKETLSDEEITRQKMEVIIDRSLQQAIVAGFDEATLEKIFEDLGKKYASHPHILKEAQSRIFEERSQRISGKID